MTETPKSIPVSEALKKPGRPRVMFGMPTRDMVHMDFALSMMEAVATSCLAVEILPANPRSCYVQCNRNDVVNSAFDNHADWIWWVDSDIEAPGTALLRLLGWQKDIVGATYIRRSEPYESLLGEPVNKSGFLPLEGLEEMVRIPTGMLLTKVDVFRAFEPPWLWLTWDKAKRQVALGDDYYFCAEARK